MSFVSFVSVNGNEYVVWISQNGPAVRGASVTFQADLYSSDGSRPEGKFRFNWMDNTLPSPHDFTVSNSVQMLEIMCLFKSNFNFCLISFLI